MKPLLIAALASFLLAGCNAAPKGATHAAGDDDGFEKHFNVPRANFASTGRNDYFILEPGYQLVLESDDERLAITVLDETRIVDGVETRVVEERECKRGKLAEVSRNFFAIDRTTRDVYYFGEEVDDYKDDKIVSHGGAWLSGVNGARYGLFIPAKPAVGRKYYQEIAPAKAMDRAEVVATNVKYTTPAGSFDNCVKIKESSAIERGIEHKTYAPGVGLLNDGDMKLIRRGPVQK